MENSDDEIDNVLFGSTLDLLIEKDLAYKLPFASDLVFVELGKKFYVYQRIKDTNIYKQIKYICDKK